MVVFGLVGMQMSCEKIKAVRKVIKEIAGRNYLRAHNRRVSQKKKQRASSRAIRACIPVMVGTITNDWTSVLVRSTVELSRTNHPEV